MIKLGIIGGTGYLGGELLRLLISHPGVEVTAVTSRRRSGEYVYRVHPNLRNNTTLRFVPPDIDKITGEWDFAFMATPHGAGVNLVPKLLKEGLKVIDLSADYRLKDASDYDKWYGWSHPHPELLSKAVYGMPELHREEVREASLVACPGCMPTATILGLAPLVKEGVIEEDRVVVDVDIGSSGGGASPTPASHHPERFGGVRAYRVAGHRHIAEIEQELGEISKGKISVAFTAHAVNMVRGILSTIHVFPKKTLSIPQVWRVYRSFYRDEAFVRLVRDVKALQGLPNPSVVMGSNFCDIGFELDSHFNHLVVLSAVDNLVKGGAGQGVQCLNIMLGIDERTGLEGMGYHPM